MADLTQLLGGAFTPPESQAPPPLETQIRDAMTAAGLNPPDRIMLDGQIHRFNSGTKGSGGKLQSDKSGWYVIYTDGIPAGRIGCWRSGIEVQFRADIGRTLSPVEEMAHVRRMEEARRARDAEIERTRENASNTVQKIWEGCTGATDDHPYLKRKGVKSNGARVTGDGRLVVPLYGEDGELSSLQYIDYDGDKKYHPGGATGGKFWRVGSGDESGAVYIAEGFATAATVHEVTGAPCYVAYSASNLVSVTGILREQNKTADLVIVADNDKSGVGRSYAEQACAKHGARMVIPPVEGDANDYHQAGYDLAALLAPEQDDYLIQADEFSAQPAPISWLVKRWVQSEALGMVHGPSGGGKTFFVLSLVCSIAAGFNDWFGLKVKPGTVAYLAGEGHHGMRGRIAAWKQRHNVKCLDMFVSRHGVDLNTQEGLRRVIHAMRSLKKPPSLIVVDTLHRFLNGDENSAQDAKTMLDACAHLMQEFRCGVILVHHTGVSDEAQHRARGSSAWRGALDIEISVVPGKNGAPIEIIQRKSKDAELAEPIYAKLESVPINGWIDEDGEQVTSAVFVQEDAPVKQETTSKIASHIKMLRNAWFYCAAEEREGRPYISRSGLSDYLVSKQGIKESSVKIYLKPSQNGRLISDLLLAEMIEPYEHGWLVIDPAAIAQWMMDKKSD